MTGHCGKEHPVSFEALEPRLLLDGNVTMVVDKVLELVGDAGNNAIVIDVPFLGQMRVSGVGGTTINGAADVTEWWAGGIDVLMTEGSNNIHVDTVEIIGNLNIETGDLPDNIRIEDSIVRGKTAISTGDGPDRHKTRQYCTTRSPQLTCFTEH